MTRQFRIEHQDDTSEVLPHVESREEEEFGKQDLATFTTYRDAANNVSLTEAEDEVFLVVDGTDEFGGLLKDIVRKGAETELVIDSFERYARDAEPTSSGETYSGAASGDVVRDVADDVPQLSRGTIDDVETGLDFVFAHASQAFKARKAEEVTSGELKYRADKTIDFVDSLGSDKSATTLSPSNQNVISDMEVSRVGGEERVTHLRVLGAGEGKHQITSEVVASSYSQGDRQIWRTVSNKDIQDQSQLDSLAQTLIDEMNTQHVDVECTVRDEDIELGDKFTVQKPEENLDQVLRVVAVETIIGSSGTKYSVMLSSRQKSRKTETSQQRQDVQNYNRGFEGNAVTVNTSGGRQPVNADENYEFDVYYPDEVKYEHRVNLRVKGMPYRAFSSGAQQDATDTENSDSAIWDQVTWQNNETKTKTLTLGNDWSNHPVMFYFRVGDLGFIGTDAYGADFGDKWQVNFVTSGITNIGEGYERVYSSVDRTRGDPNSNVSLGAVVQEYDTMPYVFTDNTVEVHVTNKTGHNFEPDEQAGETIDVENITVEIAFFNPRHTHPPDPGLKTFDGTNGTAALYPSNCDVLVNGTSVGTSFGDGTSEFEEVADLEGLLTPGQWNTIEISSDAIGHLMAHLDIDVYRQILGRG